MTFFIIIGYNLIQNSNKKELFIIKIDFQIMMLSGLSVIYCHKNHE